jgi:hypothetical protein
MSHDDAFLYTDMTFPVSGDLQAQTELLTFFVISHLATIFATGEWMSTENTVESSTYWSKALQRDEDVVARVMLTSRALLIAKVMEAETGITLSGSALASIFESNMRLDFSSATTREIYHRGETYLLAAK